MQNTNSDRPGTMRTTRRDVVCCWLYRYLIMKVGNPPGPCGLSRLGTLSSLSSFGRKVYLSLNLSPGAPSPILSLTFWISAVSPNRIKRQARASKTPKTQAGHIVDFLFGFGLSYKYHAEPFGSLIVFGLVARPKTIQNHWLEN